MRGEQIRKEERSLCSSNETQNDQLTLISQRDIKTVELRSSKVTWRCKSHSLSIKKPSPVKPHR